MREAGAHHVCRSSLACAALVLGVVLSGCTGPEGPVRPACGGCEGPERYVRLQRIGAEPSLAAGAARRHPFTLDAGNWARILEDIHARPARLGFVASAQQDPPGPRFEPDQIAYLADSLSKAMKRAGDAEWAVFAVTRGREWGLVEITSGAWYVQADNLHLVLPNCWSAVSMPGVLERMLAQPLVSLEASACELSEEPHRIVAVRPQGRDGVLAPGVPDLAIDYLPLLVAGSDTSPERRAPGEAGIQPRASAQAGPAPASLEARLRALRRLKDQALITDEEYRTKRKQLLDRF